MILRGLKAINKRLDEEYENNLENWYKERGQHRPAYSGRTRHDWGSEPGDDDYALEISWLPNR